MYVVTDSDAKNVYGALYAYYAGQQLPDGSTGVFFGFDNYTKDKLIYTIEFMKRNYNLGWFTDNFDDRAAAIAKIADSLYKMFDYNVDWDGIKKFCNWVYSFAAHDPQIANYFSGAGSFTLFDSIVKDVKETVGSKVSSALETVSYGVQYPSLKSLLPETGTVVKWGLIIGGLMFAANYLSNKLK